MKQSTTPRLAQPGAGLPKLELIIARLIFALRSWRGNRESFAADFSRERELIRALLSRCSPELCGRQVLIPRLQGLEDSSRYWSIWMTLDHLRIVHQSMVETITLLAGGETPARAASTALVKPQVGVGAEVVDAYEASCEALLQAVEAVSDLKTLTRYAHPWFGPLDAAGWHALSAMHLGIHRRQIERIIAQAHR